MRLDNAGLGHQSEATPGKLAQPPLPNVRGLLLSDEPLSNEPLSNERSATARERARALVLVAVIFGSAALVAGLMLRTTEGAALGVVLLALTAFGGALAWKFERI